MDSLPDPRPLRVVSLFSGIGGGDLGLHQAGHAIVEMCESWAPARRVLASRFPGMPIAPDVVSYTPDVSYDMLAAGFPCTDLSHAGSQTGIFGPKSGLVEHVFRIASLTAPSWILLENVPNILRLHKGAGIRYIVEQLEHLGYQWAYRTVDARAFGVAQRRNRVIILASRVANPAPLLLAQDSPAADSPNVESMPSGFYWTEGRRGTGLVSGAVPTLKGGSTLGLPSAPALWIPRAPVGRQIVLPSIEDAEELQGLRRGWTEPADVPNERSQRWKLVGNAITVPIAEWVGTRLLTSEQDLGTAVSDDDFRRTSWPEAAFGRSGEVFAARASRHPLRRTMRPLEDVVDHATTTPLSHRATRGFLSRVEESGVSLPSTFIESLETHLQATRPRAGSASWASTPAVRARMQKVGQKNTTPELRLRRALTARNIRYRLQVRPIPELRWRSDIVFKSARLAVELRGCFWHVCPVHQSWPKAHAERWREKLERNRARDLRMEAELQERGWEVLVVWEHESADIAAERVEEALRRRRQPSL